ncbi:L-threonylcarbamoyladenylate synthase [Chloroflexota bacterium]
MVSKLSLNIQEQIEKGISILRQGGIIAYPTDTVYGLGASAILPQAIERIYSVKTRPRNMPLPLLLADISQITGITMSLPHVAELLLKHFSPGALTLVLPVSSSVPAIVTAGGSTVAVRIPAHPVAVALAKGIGAPLVGTSANIYGKPSPLSADEVYSQLGDKIDFIIDGGRSPGGIESTIVDVTGEKPVILREGAISGETLKEVCGDIIMKEEN